MKKYVLYAFGEIMLVVIGILVALQIDDWNEERKEQEKLISIFEIISSDIKRDTTRNNFVIKEYKEKERKLRKVLSSQVSDQELYESLYQIDSYQPMTINLKGLNLLRTYSSTRLSINDTLIANILNMYSYYESLIPTYSKRTEDKVLQNLADWQQTESWFSIYSLQTFNSDSIITLRMNRADFAADFLNYARSNHDYKNKVAMYNGLITIDIRLLKGFNSYAVFVLNKINQRYGFE